MSFKKGIFISINYNNSQTTINYIKSILNMSNFLSLDILIIDNGSKNSENQKLEAYIKSISRQNITLMHSNENLGYFGAVNYGIKQLNDKFNRYEFCIVSNNDIIIKDKFFINKILQYCEKYDVIAPSIFSLKSNKNQNPHRMNPPSISEIYYYKFFFTNYLVSRLLLKMRVFLKKINQHTHSAVTNECNIFSPHGAFIIFSKRFFLNGGYIDDNFFLYGEEDSIAGICLEKNIKIRFIPDLVVYHDENSTIILDEGYKKQIYLHQKNAHNYIKKKYNLFKIKKSSFSHCDSKSVIC